MKNILTFLALAFAMLGLLGGIGYTAYNGAYFIAVGIIILGYLAYPKAKEMFKSIIK